MARLTTGVRLGTVLALAIPSLAAAQVPAGPGPSLDYAQSEQYNLRVEYDEFRPSLTGQVRKSGTVEGSLIDFDNDLVMDDERTFQVRGAIQFKQGRKVRGSYTKFDYDGDTAIQRTLRFGETRYLVGERVVSSIKGAYYTAEFEYDFMQGPKGFLGAIVGGKGFDLDSVLVAPASGKRETDTLRLPIPVLGIVGRTYVGRLSLEGEFSGMTLGSRGTIWEVHVGGRAHLSDRLAGHVGYRYLSLDGEDGPDKLKVELGGLQFGLELSL